MIRLGGTEKRTICQYVLKLLTSRNAGGDTINFGDSNTEVVTTNTHASGLRAAGPTEGVAKTVHTIRSNNDDDQDDYNRDHDDYGDKFDDDKDIQTSIVGVNDVPPHLDTVEKAKRSNIPMHRHTSNVDMTNDFLYANEDIKRIEQMEHDAMKMFPHGDIK